GTAPVNFTVNVTTTTGGGWLTTSAGSSTLSTPVNALSVNVNITGLAAGTYNGNIAVVPTGGTTVNVPVTLTITAPPTVSATPASLTFTFRAGDANPVAQTINVSGGGGALGFGVTVSPSGAWLSATPLTGTT